MRCGRRAPSTCGGTIRSGSSASGDHLPNRFANVRRADSQPTHDEHRQVGDVADGGPQLEPLVDRRPGELDAVPQRRRLRDPLQPLGQLRDRVERAAEQEQRRDHEPVDGGERLVLLAGGGPRGDRPRRRRPRSARRTRTASGRPRRACVVEEQQRQRHAGSGDQRLGRVPQADAGRRCSPGVSGVAAAAW